MLITFELDSQIAHHTIYSQADSIGKAIMNVGGARASDVLLTLTRKGVGIFCVEDYLKWWGEQEDDLC